MYNRYDFILVELENEVDKPDCQIIWLLPWEFTTVNNIFRFHKEFYFYWVFCNTLYMYTMLNIQDLKKLIFNTSYECILLPNILI